eukprot:snap_masked-scaffold9108_size2501-processed-gene-0.0 protein:Tk01855 transcript:snap_masked-scaffold9108_size2501-processed-gene-0.0-mRNA-1 annotation:"serine threonine protein kinase"
MSDREEQNELTGLNPQDLLKQAGAGQPGQAAQPTPNLHWTPPPVSEVQNLIDGYHITHTLGIGGMGVVYQATQLSLQRQVAIKLLPAELSKNPEFLERFRREAQITAKLEHPNIVHIYQNGITSTGHCFYIMELVEGESLAQHLLKKPSIEATLKLLPPLCRALEYAHQNGVIHRDLKPQNILLSKTGELKIVDFGLAKILTNKLDDIHLTRSDAGMGTPYYAAPEQTLDTHNVDHRADIYSLGVLVYQMVTGKLPQGKWETPSHCSSVDVRVDELLERAMHPDPDGRMGNVREFREGVEAIISSPYRKLVMRTLRPGLRMMDILWSTCGIIMFLLMLSALLRAQSPSTGTLMHVFGNREGTLDGIYLMLTIFCPIFYTLMGCWAHQRWQTCQNYGISDRLPTPFGFLAEKGSPEYPWIASFWVLLIYLLPCALVIHFTLKMITYSMSAHWINATVHQRFTDRIHGWWDWDPRILTLEPNLYGLGRHPNGDTGSTFWPVITPTIILAGALLTTTLATLFLYRWITSALIKK